MPIKKDEEGKVSKNPRKLFTKPRFFETPILVDADKVTIELPLGILAHMDFKEPKAHWTIINGVLQISGNQPQVGIPILTNGVEFESQS